MLMLNEPITSVLISFWAYINIAEVSDVTVCVYKTNIC